MKTPIANRRDYRRRIPYESYAQLVRMVVPRALKIIFYDGTCAPIWISDGVEGPELRDWAESLLQTVRSGTDRPTGTLHLNESREPSYLFVVRDDFDKVLALLGIVCRAPPVNAEAARLATLEHMLKPILDIARQDLLIRHETAESEPVERSAPKSNAAPDVAPEADPIRNALKQIVAELGCAFGAVVVPEYSLELSQTTDDRNTSAASALAKAQAHVLTWLQIRRRALMVNKVRGNDDRLPPYKLLAAPIAHRSGRLIGMLALFKSPAAADFSAEDLSKSEQIATQLTDALESQYDAATGQLTRQTFEARAREALTQASAQTPCTLAYLDIDELSHINDAFGYIVGDQAIAAIGGLLRVPLLPEGAFASRIYSDRFALLLPHRSAKDSLPILERLRAATADAVRLGDLRRVQLTFSAGVAETTTASALDHLLAAAESGCKIAKLQGRNRIEIYRPATVAHAVRDEKVATMAKIRDALDAGAFQLHAQVISPLRDAHRPTRFEILVRLNEAGTLHAPEKFLSAAVECNLMPEVDRWVVSRTLEALRQHADVLQPSNVEFAINIAAQSLAQPSFAEFLAEEFRHCPLPADVIFFEITEHDARANPQATEAFVRQVTALGCRIAIDNFGVGLASLSSLKTLDVACLKIDGSLVREIPSHPRAETLVRAVAQLARSMEIETVAECVESDAIREKLLSLGVDYAQGFAVGKPYPLDAMLAELKLMELLAADAEAAKDLSSGGRA
jgi:diguanylate cyclase (GGDEF)-like protein